MLTCYGHEVQLPQNDLANVGFCLAALNTPFDFGMASMLPKRSR